MNRLDCNLIFIRYLCLTQHEGGRFCQAICTSIQLCKVLAILRQVFVDTNWKLSSRLTGGYKCTWCPRESRQPHVPSLFCGKQKHNVEMTRKKFSIGICWLSCRHTKKRCVDQALRGRKQTQHVINCLHISKEILNEHLRSHVHRWARVLVTCAMLRQTFLRRWRQSSFSWFPSSWLSSVNHMQSQAYPKQQQIRQNSPWNHRKWLMAIVLYFIHRFLSSDSSILCLWRPLIFSIR